MPDYDGIRFSPPAPLAHVTLNDRKSRASVSDVPMLIDTGSDLTLIPRAIVEDLGVSIDSNQGCELIGYDGRGSMAPVVMLDLVFLGRVFRGQLLVINDEIGILGRFDVLGGNSGHDLDQPIIKTHFGKICSVQSQHFVIG